MRPTRFASNAGGMLPALCVSLLAAAPAPLLAQAKPAAAKPTPLEASVDRLAKHPAVTASFAALQTENAWTLDQQASICQIPAPPFKEQARAAEYAKRFRELGVQNVRIDKEGNVIGEVRGARPGPTLMLAGHLDTVFPEGTDVRVKREGTKLIAPGIGDDCRGLAVVLAVTKQVITQKIPFSGRLLVVGNVGEEGPGNLRGMRAIFAGPLRDSINMFISIDGTGFGVTNGGVGSNRYRVHYKGPGGHSYGAFGMPNPMHAMGRAIAKIADLEASTTPKVTFNVGIVSGGTSVNSIPFEAIMEIDLRSETAAALAEIDARLQKALREAVVEEKARWPQSKAALTLQIDTMGLRPAGTTPDTSFIVRASLAAARTMNVYAPLTISSTDANVPMNLRIPAVTLDGGGVGRGAHSLDESYDDRNDGYKGPQWVLLAVLGMLGVK
ncbi:M20/M25/M40 family metallo-hydrolase [Gemmatimonas sp.]|jgi:tripeptide aminopeptidase|uniref:M20/M25/M40 family metallo-hydrolase n=1 Tax=Gemmatimonas sp. TaxID=1962908 RepID=UPI0025B84120|nr:M20/M25/M40 family metallo-hydrolase [Gemmatimonas sp.]MCA2996310.1 M20/M25/M40 family metallo-hydrolase [Gemmatimonas sp.]